MSNKRKIKLTEEDLQHGNNVKKIIKKDQAGDLAENLQESSLILKQAHLTKFFVKNKTQAQKPEPMEEEKKLPSAKEKMQTVTLTISDSESEDTHYSDKQEKQEKQKKTAMQEEPIVAAKPTPQRRTLRDMPNVVFYMNMSQSRPFGDYIEKIHRYWKGDYKKLESHHGFVQWLFPNYYGSAFNKDSFTLNPDEAMIFRENKEIAERLVRSYEMMLDFYGMQLVDKKTGKLARANHYLARYRLALLSNFHNHLRIKRILSHLSITGFRAYAVELVNFLEVEIYGEKGGYKEYLAETKPLKQEYIKKISTNPLYGLVKCDIFKDWSIYAEPTNQKELNFLTFTTQVASEKEFEPSVLLRSK